MPSLLENKLLLQYMAAAGQDIGQGQPIGSNVNAVTQSNIAAQNYAKLLKQLLEGGGKLNMDKENISLKAPIGAFRGPSARNLASVSGQLDTTNVTPSETIARTEPQLQQSQTDLLSTLLSGNLGVINPSGSPLDINPADLAGLTPTDISQAVGIRLSRDAMIQRQQEAMQAQQASMMAAMAKDTRTADVKNYEYAVGQGFSGTFQDFKQSTSTASQKDYEYAVSQGYEGTFQQWLTDIAKAGATKISLGEQVEKKKALGSVEGQLHFTTGEFTKDVEKFKSSEYYKDLQFRASTGDTEAQEQAINAVGNYINNQIEAKGGTIQKVEWSEDGNTAIWTVQWPGGDVTKVRHRVRD